LLAKALGHEEWLDDPRFATIEARALNSPALVAMLDAVFAEGDFETWRDRLLAGGVTFGIVGRIDDHLFDDQIAANGFFTEFVDGDGLRTMDSPFYLTGTDKAAPRMAPGIGQHTEAILKECGLSDAEIAALTAEG
jgi:crotonobetainyl-CoA:carnitine CoA-transferase CaiB-like acyl-CoA transferase